MLEDIIPIGLTFDDVLLVPNESAVLPGDVDISTLLTKKITLNTPLISAAMDTVTTDSLAIALAREGGIGFIHRAMSIKEQAAQVASVKKHESVIIANPKTVQPHTTVKEIRSLMKTYKISGFPVITSGEKLVGIVTNRDLRGRDSRESAEAIMTKKVITATKGISSADARKLMYNHRIEKLPLIHHVAKNKILAGLITLRDIESREKYPNACKDERGRLRVGAAIGTSSETLERTQALIEAGVDIIAIDTAHGHSQKVLKILRELRATFPDLEIVAGNVATAKATFDLIQAGASAVKVGVGPGSICTTRIIAGVGVPQLTAIKECAGAANKFNIPVIADGGIKYSGDITKALAAGASSVMIGGLFAGTDESPGELIKYQGQKYKTYRGMGSLGAMESGSADRYAQAGIENKKLVPEGIEGMVPYKGRLAENIHQLIGGLRSGMGYCGCKDILELHEKARFIRITPSGLRESHVHDVTVTKEAPNYAS